MSITFPVSDVTPGEPPGPLEPFLHVAAQALHPSQDTTPSGWPAAVQAWNGPATLLSNGALHGFVATALTAFQNHLPLSLSPDHVWLLVAQGLALHIAQDPERYRHRLVSHQGKLPLLVQRDFTPDAPDNDWPGVVAEYSAKIEAHLGHDLLTPTFSTTGPLERVVAQIGLMDTVSHYFEYRMETICGIPTITLEGTQEDWARLCEHAELLDAFEMSWWLDALRPLLKRFLISAQGRGHRPHWQSFVKWNDVSGGPFLTGWIQDLFPYLITDPGTYSPRSSFGNPRAQTTTQDLPHGINHANVGWDHLGQEVPLTFYAGFFGSSITKEGAVRPGIGWLIERQGASGS